jgi:predicted O-methyltransferase YrrM
MSVPADDDPELRRAYARYVTEVSHPQHAVSIQLAFYLWELLEARRPRRAADLGSGFSSYVLRLYAKRRDPEVEVFSVDDDAGWLERTRGFLETEGLSTERLMLWEDFSAGELDLVLHDLGTMPTRAATLADAISRVRPGGAIVLDDVHMPGYRTRVEQELARLGVRHASAEDETLDMLGRYSWIALP